MMQSVNICTYIEMYIFHYLIQDEDINIKMRQLTSSARVQRLIESRPMELSLALVVFAVVILVGIVGLGIVVCHRQKRKRQLKALLRSKN